MRRRAPGLMLAVMLVASSCARGPAGQPPSGRTPQAAATASRENLKALADPDNLLTALDSLEQRVAAMPRAEFDVAARGDALGADVDRLFAFVRDQVRYEVYRGVLRGPRGALMGQAGNAFDKSLLLGALLRHHGVDVRFARARLSEAQAKALVARMFASARQVRIRATASPVESPPQAVVDASKAIAMIATARWFSNLTALRAALARDRVSLAAVPVTTVADLAAEAADHVWVEYRAGDRWIALDPSMKDASPGQTFARAEETWGEIPASHYHRVTIRVLLEERGADGLKTREVLRHEAPAADLHGAMVTFSHQFAPSALVGTVTPVLQIDGQSFPGEQVGVTGLGGGISRLGERLFGTLGAAPERGEKGLSAEWFVFDFASPSDQVETVRREIFDRIGPAARAERREAETPLMALPEGQSFPPGLATIFAFSFRAGRVHPTVPLIRMVDDIPRLRAATEAASAVRRLGRDPTEQERRQLAAAAAPMLPEMLATLATSFYVWSQRGTTFLRPPGLMFYEATPRLVIAAAGTSDPGTEPAAGSISLDLRRNDLRTVAEEEVPSRSVVWASALRGILDGVLEDVLVREVLGVASGLAMPVGAVTILDQAVASGVPLVTVTARDGILRLRMRDAARARMLESLADQVALVTPARAVAVGGSERLAWWRMDLRSGETLAVQETGLHFTVLEFTVQVGIIVALAAAAIPLYELMLEVVYLRELEDNPWCAGIAAFQACVAQSGGEKPPGCYPYDAPEGGVYWTCR